MLLHTRIGHRGHKLNLLGDCLDICTTLPLYYQIAMCRMATKSCAEMNIFSTRAFVVCLLLCVPQGRDVFANYTGTILQVTHYQGFLRLLLE
jgi:hypothetical protein